MKVRYILSILGIMLLFACQTRSDKAAVYNDAIIDQQIEIMMAFNQMDSVMNELSTEELEDTYLILRGKVKEGLKGLDGMGEFEKDGTLLTASWKLFRGYDGLMQDEYARLIEILQMPDTTMTLDIQQEAFDLESDIVLKMKELHKEYEQKQREFGEKYHVVFE